MALGWDVISRPLGLFRDFDHRWVGDYACRWATCSRSSVETERCRADRCDYRLGEHLSLLLILRDLVSEPERVLWSNDL